MELYIAIKEWLALQDSEFSWIEDEESLRLQPKDVLAHCVGTETIVDRVNGRRILDAPRDVSYSREKITIWLRNQIQTIEIFARGWDDVHTPDE